MAGSRSAGGLASSIVGSRYLLDNALRVILAIVLLVSGAKLLFI